MCYRIPADAEKTVSEARLSSMEESMLTPRKDLDEIKDHSISSESGVTAMFHKLLAPFSKENGGPWRIDDIETEISDDKLEVDKVS